VKALMYGEPAVWHALMDRLAETFAAYVAAKVRAGADVVQLFDSWVGALSPADYREFVAPYSARILAAVDVPTIHFGTGTATLLADMAEAGGDVIGLDWRIPLDRGWADVGDRAVQGNLDPATLLGPWDRLAAAADDVLRRADGRPGHIFNLGHGVFPQTDPAALGRLREHVHERTAVSGRV
jgi:uroporphyrinogen decarboxylase